jgi:serine/threonine protein kinase
VLRLPPARQRGRVSSTGHGAERRRARTLRAAQTATKLYLILDFINGGHLFFQLYRAGIFEEALARVYTAELVLALTHLHSLGIAHRGASHVAACAKRLPAAAADVLHACLLCSFLVQT